jgi:hypothetical protein
LIAPAVSNDRRTDLLRLFSWGFPDLKQTTRSKRSRAATRPTLSIRKELSFIITRERIVIWFETAVSVVGVVERGKDRRGIRLRFETGGDK